MMDSTSDGEESVTDAEAVFRRDSDKVQALADFLHALHHSPYSLKMANMGQICCRYLPKSPRL